jgi:hypothetical protein
MPSYYWSRIHFNIILQYMPISHNEFLTSGFITAVFCLCILYCSHSRYMANQSHPLWRVHSNNIRWRVQITQLLKSNVLWDVMPCSAVDIHGSFGGTYCLHLQGKRYVTQATNKENAASRAAHSACFLLNILLTLKMERNTFLRNFGKVLPDCVKSHPKQQ